MNVRGPQISICVPSYREHGEPNLRTLSAALPEALDGLRGELVVVLNGLTAEQALVPPHAVIVDFETNRGVSKAWNAGARAASGPILCFANDDVVPGAGSLRLPCEALTKHADAGVVGPEGSLWEIASGDHLDYVPTGDLALGELREADAISGFLFATRSETWRRAGGFDEAYTPCGYEEIDYCTTARLGLGLRNHVVGGVSYRHDFGISMHRPWARIRHNGRTEFLRTIMRRNRRYFLSKWRNADAAMSTESPRGSHRP
jgi:GT2 family glycosyltransferase